MGHLDLMRLFDRLLRSRDRREAHIEGLHAGVGLLVPDPGASSEHLACPVCGNTAHPVLVDLAEQRSVIRCPSCRREWQTDHRPASLPRSAR